MLKALTIRREFTYLASEVVLMIARAERWLAAACMVVLKPMNGLLYIVCGVALGQLFGVRGTVRYPRPGLAESVDGRGVYLGVCESPHH